MTDYFKLKSIELSGFKSIDNVGERIDFNDITIFLGANGSGKSNLLSFFSLLKSLVEGELQLHIAAHGTTNSILYYGSDQTTSINAHLIYQNTQERLQYKFKLDYAVGDKLIIAEEQVFDKEQSAFINLPNKNNFQESYFNKLLHTYKEQEKITEADWKVYLELATLEIYQFHDTSSNAKIRQNTFIHSNERLLSDGSNLSAFLYHLKFNHYSYYERILRYVRQMMPQFGDFELEPLQLNDKYNALNWRERGSDYLFGAHQISDGTLRFMALATLLLQPPTESLPSIIIIDEPELGLHPSAIALLSGMIKTASKHCQIILATQSPRLVDEFLADNIVIVERNEERKSTIFKKQNEVDLQMWLERYSLSELWEKNVMGGQP